MTPIEIADAISELALEPFDRAEFPFQFLAAFGNKETTLKKLRAGASNASDLDEGVLQRNNIHIAACAIGAVNATLTALRESPKTASAKVKFILATDGEEFQAEDLASGETVACDYTNFDTHFGFFLPLAGVTNVKEIKETELDRRAASRLKKLYVELLSANPEWAGAERREDMNKFMARLIFCFFAEDTDIIHPSGLFTKTVEQMGSGDASDTHHVISEIFRAMDAKLVDREVAGLPTYAKKFPYVNGGLFSGSIDCPRFTKISRSYLFHIGNLDWKRINPDIFGSMMQAVADDEERGALGMHYTSVPNILKVLNPLFLNGLREKLEEAGDNGRKLLNLRNRIASIRVFDPACGSGNFLVIAYKEMRTIEAVINKRRGEYDRRSDISVKNFRGIELRPFAAEIARLALIIAEYQCDVLYRGQKEALAEFLPLNSENWIICGNALRLDWLSICPPTGAGVRVQANDLFQAPLDQAEIDFENEGGETYICGNPPYLGTKFQEKSHKADIEQVFAQEGISFGNVDYIGCWFALASRIIATYANSSFAFVSTSSLFQGEQAEIFLHLMKRYEISICWAHEGFRWSNNASNNAGVICCIVGCSAQDDGREKFLFEDGVKRRVHNIGPYLVPMGDLVVTKRLKSLSGLSSMGYGSMSNDGGNFDVSTDRYRELTSAQPQYKKLIKLAVGGAEFIRGLVRYSVYMSEGIASSYVDVSEFEEMFSSVRSYRLQSSRDATRKLSEAPQFFAERRHVDKPKIFVPQVLSERREYVTAGLLQSDALVIAPHMQIVDGGMHELAILSSRMHHVWVATVCGRLKSDIRYSNLLGWNTFPIPKLTEQNILDLCVCAENILIAREAHFPATIADLYVTENMPDDLRRAHEANDEVIERIYVGRTLRNNSERLKILFDLFQKLSV